jgi:hypothetical protein
VVAAGADQHLRAAARAQKKPPSCIPLLGLVTQTWTKRATGGILPRHTCSARCGARRRYELRKVGIGAAPVLNEDRGFSAPSPALGVATSPDASEIGRTSRRSARSAEQQETDPQVKVRSLQWPPSNSSHQPSTPEKDGSHQPSTGCDARPPAGRGGAGARCPGAQMGATVRHVTLAEYQHRPTTAREMASLHRDRIFSRVSHANVAVA